MFNTLDELVGEAEGTTTFANGKFAATVELPDTIKDGQYTLRVKSSKYLRKRIIGFANLQAGGTYTSPETQLVAGDIDGDNKLNVLDYTQLLDCYTVDQPAKACDTGKKANTDLTDDGKVNQFDLNLFIREFSVQTGE